MKKSNLSKLSQVNNISESSDSSDDEVLNRKYRQLNSMKKKYTKPEEISGDDIFRDSRRCCGARRPVPHCVFFGRHHRCLARCRHRAASHGRLTWRSRPGAL